MNSVFPHFVCTATHGNGQHWRPQAALEQPYSSTRLSVGQTWPPRNAHNITPPQSRVWHLYPSEPCPAKPRNPPHCQGPTEKEVATLQILTVAQQEADSFLASRVPWSFYPKITNHLHWQSKTNQNSPLQHNTFGWKMAGFPKVWSKSLSFAVWWQEHLVGCATPGKHWITASPASLHLNKSQQCPGRGFAYCPCSSSWHIPERKGWIVTCSPREAQKEDTVSFTHSGNFTSLEK